MRKFIGFIAAYLSYYIGHMFCRISYLKVKGKFVFDENILGDWLADNYQRFMNYSTKIQDWGGSGPWKNVAS